MIVRILSVRIAPDRGAEFHAFVREHGLPQIQEHPGLVSAYVGRRTEGADELAIIITIWRDWQGLEEALGPEPSHLHLLTQISEMVVSSSVEHFEGIDLPSLSQVEGTDDGAVVFLAPPVTT